MGIFDSILNAASSRETDSAPSAELIDSLTGLLCENGNGGLAGLVQRFGDAGLGDVIGSWIGRGENAPVSASQLQDVLGSDFITGLAQKLGIDPATAADLAVQWLPRLIDAFTPHGKLPQQPVGHDPDLLSAIAGALLRSR